MVQLYGFSTQPTWSPCFNKASTGMLVAATPLPKTSASSAPSNAASFWRRILSVGFCPREYKVASNSLLIASRKAATELKLKLLVCIIGGETELKYLSRSSQVFFVIKEI